MPVKVNNLTIWTGVVAANQLGQQHFPVRTSLALAKLGNRLQELRKPIEEARKVLVDKYAQKGEDGKQKTADNGNILLTDAPAFSREFDELMALPCNEIVIDEKIKLPEKVMSTCDKCHHNMDRPLEIEPAILMALEPFVEIMEPSK